MMVKQNNINLQGEKPIPVAIATTAGVGVPVHDGGRTSHTYPSIVNTDDSMNMRSTACGCFIRSIVNPV
jgi:hypothetical protein